MLQAIPEVDSILWKTGGALCPTGKSLWDYLPNLDALISSRFASTGVLANPAVLTSLTNYRIGLLGGVESYLDVAVSSRAAESGGKLANITVPIQFPSAEALDTIAVTAATDTTEKEITISLPTGASIVRVMLAAFITAMNNTANAQKIDVDVKGRPSGGSWSTFFSQDDVIGFPAADGATTGFVPLQDVSALVTAAGTYGFKLTITQSSANSVRYTTQFLLLVTYKMS